MYILKNVWGTWCANFCDCILLLWVVLSFVPNSEARRFWIMQYFSIYKNGVYLFSRCGVFSCLRTLVYESLGCSRHMLIGGCGTGNPRGPDGPAVAESKSASLSQVTFVFQWICTWFYHITDLQILVEVQKQHFNENSHVAFLSHASSERIKSSTLGFVGKNGSIHPFNLMHLSIHQMQYD